VLRRANQTSSLAPLLASTVVKFGASGLLNCGLLRSDVVRHDTFTMPVSSMPNVPAVLTRTSSAHDPATNGPGVRSLMAPICPARYFEYGMSILGPKARGCLLAE